MDGAVQPTCHVDVDAHDSLPGCVPELFTHAASYKILVLHVVETARLYEVELAYNKFHNTRMCCYLCQQLDEFLLYLRGRL